MLVEIVEGSGLKCLKALKKSARNCRLRDSPSLKPLVAEKSSLNKPGNRTAPVRGDVPNSPGCGAVNAAVLNCIIGVLFPRAKFAICPGTTSGRDVCPVPVFDVPE